MTDQTNAVVEVKPFNISDFEARDTAWLELENIKGDGPLLVGGKPARALIRSPGTKEAMDAQHRIDTATTIKTYAAMRGKHAKETVEGNITQRADKLAAVTVEFDNFPVAPADVFKNPKLGHITEQVAKFHGDWANF